MKLRKNVITIILTAVMLLGMYPTVEAKAASGIPSSAVAYQGNKYQLYYGRMNYRQAKAFCEKKGGHLAVIETSRENTFLRAYLRQKKCTSAYFGVTDYRRAGTWTDVNGKKISYKNWKYSLKAMLKSPGKRYAMLMNSNGKWVNGDFKGNTKTAFLCEWDGAAPSTPKVTSVNVRTGVVKGKCDKGTTVKLSVGGRMYSAKTDSSGVFRLNLNYKNLRGWQTVKLYAQGKHQSTSRIVSFKAYFLGKKK
ncbi:MAG TPA: C-type lectin domain-containing protein [Candidatus Blautia faecipullorum]|nr:C-type lectin domain-containing protein [Candidatus Blautia faecipullorum]